MSAEEEGSISFWDPHFHEYLASVQFGIPINQALMDYFYHSSFYERDCNNETCAMQNLTRVDDFLKKMTGIQYYVVDHKVIEDGTLSIIQKCRRESPEKIIPISYYYILRGTIYRAPYFMSALSTRLCNALHYIEEAIHRLADDEQELREEHLENAEAMRTQQSFIAAPAILAMKNLVDKFPVEQKEPPKLPNKRKLEDRSPAPSPKRQKI